MLNRASVTHAISFDGAMASLERRKTTLRSSTASSELACTACNTFCMAESQSECLLRGHLERLRVLGILKGS